jgi:hypothetical protein
MKTVSIVLITIILALGDFNRISTINQHKKAGENAYRAGDYPKAIESFKLLVDSLGVEDESVTINLANAYFQSSDTTNAAYYYSRLAESPEAAVRSSALNQLGVIDQQKNNLEGALANFKNALKADPANENARYNYELVKKLLEQQQQQDQQQNQDQENEDQQDQQQDQQQQQNQDQQQQDQDQQKEQEQQQDQQQQEQEEQQQEQNQDSEQKEEGNPQQEEQTGEEGEDMDQQPPKSRQEKLEELNLTEEKARMILEAMKNNEMQYLQQMQRKPTKKQDSDKPDW